MLPLQGNGPPTHWLRYDYPGLGLEIMLCKKCFRELSAQDPSMITIHDLLTSTPLLLDRGEHGISNLSRGVSLSRMLGWLYEELRSTLKGHS